MNRKLIVLQDGIKECGSAALLSIIRYYGGDIPLSKLVELTNTTKDGTNFLNMKNACLELGFNAVGYQVEYDNLLLIDTPFIAQLKNQGYTHFVVVYKIKDRLHIMDPASGYNKETKEQFLNKWTGYILIIEPYKTPVVYKETKEISNILYDFVIKNKKELLNTSILGLIYALVSSLTTYNMQVVLDYVINNSKENLTLITYIFIILNMYKSLTSYLRNKLIIYLNQKLDLKLMQTTYNRILYLPFNYYKNKTTGETLTRINDIVNIKTFISKFILTVQVDFIIILLCFIILYKIDKSLFVIVIIVTIIYIIITLLINKILIKLIKNLQINNAVQNSLLVETISGYETIKGLNIENIMSKKFEKKYINLLNSSLKYDEVCNKEQYIKDILISISTVLMIYFGTKSVLNSKLNLSKLITFNTIYLHYINSLRTFLDVTKDYHYAKNSLRRINSLFELEKLSQERTALVPKGNITITNMSYSFGTKQILKNISLEIKNNEKVLLLGSSGCGKSTLLKILFKYYKISRNNISINNIDLCDYTIFDIREYVTYISQKETLFNDTIKNNITLGRKINYEELDKVIKLTYIDEIVRNDILGIDKLIEENGANLSGGERQRIVLARALLKRSNILLIDEGLSEVDLELEQKILRNIFTYYSDKIVIVVSHRLNNIFLFDKIVRILNGNLLVVPRNNIKETNAYEYS